MNFQLKPIGNDYIGLKDFESMLYIYASGFNDFIRSWFFNDFPGFNLETVEYKGINFTVWDIGGQEKVNFMSNASL